MRTDVDIDKLEEEQLLRAVVRLNTKIVAIVAGFILGSVIFAATLKQRRLYENISRNQDQKNGVRPRERSGPCRSVLRGMRGSAGSLAIPEVPSPPILILSINSICNMKCEHCFCWQQLNQHDDLSFEELVVLSRELGPIENLNLSGGEPFIRKDFSPICRQFVQHNGVKESYVAQGEKRPFVDEAGVSVWQFRRSSKGNTVRGMN